MTDITPLYNPEAEKAVLGAAIVDPEIYTEIDLSEEHFFIRRHSAIWEAIGKLTSSGADVDFATICDQLDRAGKLEEVGGASYLTQLITHSPMSQHAESYAAIVKDYAKRRKWVSIATQMVNLANDKDSNLENEIIKIEDALTATAQRADGATHWMKYLDQLYDEIQARIADPKKIWGIPTGYPKFDYVTGGLHAGEMLLFSGKPGVGKSIWVMQAAQQMAKNLPGAIYSVEMPGIQTVRRSLSGVSFIDTRKMKTGEVSESEMHSLMHSFEELNALPIYMSDAADWTTSALKADLKRLINRRGIKWFVFDYMMLASDGIGLSLTERTAMLSRSFKLICRQLGLAGIIIHSMRKAGIESAMPGQEDLTGSAQGSYDADLICFLNEFSPATEGEKYLKPDEKENMRTLTFGKGRELDQPRRYIHMVKRPGFPVFGDYEKD